MPDRSQVRLRSSIRLDIAGSTFERSGYAAVDNVPDADQRRVARIHARRATTRRCRCQVVRESSSPMPARTRTRVLNASSAADSDVASRISRPGVSWPDGESRQRERVHRGRRASRAHARPAPRQARRRRPGARRPRGLRARVPRRGPAAQHGPSPGRAGAAGIRAGPAPLAARGREGAAERPRGRRVLLQTYRAPVSLRHLDAPADFPGCAPEKGRAVPVVQVLDGRQGHEAPGGRRKGGGSQRPPPRP